MMIASPTAASAAATVITMNTNTCPPMPYCCAKATKVRFTALSISSTHMNTMIALRRINTPNRPITKSTAEKKRASASIIRSARLTQHDRTDQRREQQEAGNLEREEVFVEERRRDRRDGARSRYLARGKALRERQRHWGPCLRQGEDLGENRNADRAGRELP